jgi:hypothetical protein
VEAVFAITNWVAPNPDGSDAFPGAFDTEADKRYAEYVAANFTAMLGSLTDVHPTAMQEYDAPGATGLRPSKSRWCWRRNTG